MNDQDIVERNPKKRNSNFELLRIVAIILVITEHFTFYFGGKDYASISPCTELFANTMLTFTICAVDVFLIISGYFSIKSQNRVLGKPLTLMFLSVFYVLFELVFGALVFHDFSIDRFWRALIPSNYFVNIFCGVYFISPYINKALLSLSRRGMDRMMIVLIAVLSIWPMFSSIFVDNIYGHQDGVSPIGFSVSDRGFTLVNFALSYIIGAYIRLTDFQIWKSNKTRVVFLIILVFFTTLLVTFFPQLRSTVHGVDSYDNLLVLATAVSMFMIFKKMKINNGNIVNKLASATFGVYMVHVFVMSYIRLIYNHVFAEVQTAGQYFVYYFITILSTYIFSVLFYITMNWVATPIRNYWKKTRLYNQKCFID